MRLLIVSHVPHYHYSGEYYAYSPYAREIEIWADLFSEIVIAAPYRTEQPPSDTCRIARSNIRVAAQREVGGTMWRDKLGIAVALPSLVAGLSRQMWKADAIHVRCPGNLGLLGALMAPLFSRRLIAKYAGQWNGFPGEECTVRLQREILRSRWWRGPVTVYGKQPGERAHVVNFFSSMFTAEQLLRARVSAAEKRVNSPMRVAFAGRLTRGKNVDVLLQAIASLKAEGLSLQGVVMGDGPEANSLRNLAGALGISDQIEFTGGVAPERVPDFLERSDIFVLASLSEGWPKAIAEAMAFGLVCIGSDLGMIREFLAEGRGITIPPRDVQSLSRELRRIANAPENYVEMRTLAARWAQGYSLDTMRESLRALMTEWWQLRPDQLVSMQQTSEIS